MIRKSLSDIANKYGISTTEVYAIIDKGVKTIKKGLSKPIKREKVLSRKRSSEDFYSRFEGYNKEQVDVARSKLKQRDREMIELYYGLKGEKLSQKAIGERYNTHPNYVSLIIKKGILKVQNNLENPVRMVIKKQEKKVEIVQNKTDESLLEEEKEIEEKFTNYREGNNKWLYEYLVNGDKESLNKLVEKNIRLVYYLVQKYYKDGYNYDELVSIANMGLMKAINSFDVSRIGQINFATYASTVIRNDIYMEYRRNGNFEDMIYLSDPILGDDEELTLEDSIADKEDFVEDFIEEDDYNNKKKKIYEVLKSLDQREKTVIEYLYGFKDGKKHTNTEVGKMLGLSQSYISRLSNSILEKLKDMLDEYKEEYVFSSEASEEAKRMSKVFYDMFKGVEKDVVLYSLSKFKNNNLVRLYYGLDGKTCLDYDEIANKLNLSTDEVIDKIEKIMKALLKVNGLKEKKNSNSEKTEDSKNEESKRIYGFNRYEYIVDKYGVSAIEEAFQKICKKNRDIFLDYYLYSMDLEDIYSKYHIDNDYLHQILGRTCSKIIQIIESEEPVTREEKFYALFKGFSSEEVNKILNELEEKERKIIEHSYNLKGTYLTQPKIAKKFDVSSNYIGLYVKRIINKIGALLEESKDFSKDDFYNRFNGYTTEQIDEAILKLSKKDSEIINFFYGIEGERLSVEKISDKLNLEKDDIYERLYKSINNIGKILKNDKRVYSGRGKKKKSGYEELVSKYGEEAVLELLEEFSEEKKELFKDYYGIDRDSLERQELVDKYGVAINTVYQRLDVIAKKIDSSLQNPEEIISKKKKFEKLFAGYDLKEVYKLIEKLDDKEKDYIKCCYELGDDYLSKDELMNKYQASSMNFVSLENLVKKLKSVLDNPSKGINKIDGFYKEFKGYNKTQVNDAIKLLDKKDRKFIKEFFGLGMDMLSVEEMSEKYGVSRQACYSKKDRIIVRINNFLKESDCLIKQDDFYSLFEGASKEQIDDAFKCLSEEERNILNLIYGLNCVKVGISQVAKKYNMAHSSVSLKCKKSIEKMKKYIINPNYESDEKKEEFYANFEGYSRKKVDEAVKKLNESAAQILSLYFGLEGKPMRQKDIAEIYHMNIGYISISINRSIKVIKELLENPNLTLDSKKEEKYQNTLKDNRKEQYKEFVKKYGEEKVIEEIEKISERDKGIVIDYYGLESGQLLVSEIASKYNIADSYVATCVYQIMQKISRRIENPEKFISLKSKFYKRFEGYSEGEVNKVLSLLKPNEQEMISLYYGLGEERQTARQLARKYGYKYDSQVTTTIRRKLNEIEDMLKPNDSFYLLFEGYSEEQVNEALLMLNDKHIGMVKDYYGIGTIKLKIGKIAEKYGLNSTTYVSFCLRKSIKQIREWLKNPQANKKEDKFYSNFEGYTEEEVNEAFAKLTDRQKNIISMSFGLENDCMTYREIGANLGISPSAVYCAISSSIKKIKDILEGKDDRRGKFDKILSRYGEELVKTVIKQLNDSEKGFLVLYYTLGNVKKYSLSEISNIIGVNEDKLGIIEEKILEKLEEKLKEEYKKVKIEKMKKEFQLQIVNKNNLKYIKEILSKSELNLVGLYYGLNGKDIMSIDEFSERLNVDKETVSSMIKEAIRKINTYTIGGRK